MEKYFDASYIWESIPLLIPFLKMTFMVAGLSVLFGTFLGFILTAAKIGKSKFARKVANGYTTILRCTPSIVLLFLVYYGLPTIGDRVGLNLNNIHTAVFVIITFTLQFAAAMSEVMRSAFQSIDKGQFEAAVSVGLSNSQAYRRIVFPQAFVVALPNFGNSLLAVLQEGSLAYTIGLIDVVGKANLIIAGNYNAHALEIFLALAIIYWILSIAIEQFFLKLEKVFSKGKQGLKTA
ncbi:amino acid ABC transporter permease [Sporosarcina psychrophila]|uniref:amino acid ABC transporter permease n=1 Tax=Sporosarcina psychrophila TaxID=1476 RepID=UPI00078EAFD0|nr:amino acid ABC transporter permease [Sporosarcina psychrophila]AMQ06298.1 amino acid ABC transporter permease [Sporosarcina psychrophila]